MGILADTPPAGAFRHMRRVPPDDLAFWVEHFWSVSWDLRGARPFDALTLPHPSVHLTFEAGAARVIGVHTGAFKRRLEGQGHVDGVKFRPGCFHPLLGRSVSTLRDSTVSARRVLGAEIVNAARQLHQCDPHDESARLAILAGALRHRLPAADSTAARACDCVERIRAEPAIHTVDELAAATGMRRRSLQRLFTVYVGVPVKWVIRRYRLHEVAKAVRDAAPPDWAELALRLGYFDQAHLINDFRAVAGYAPARMIAAALTARVDR